VVNPETDFLNSVLFFEKKRAFYREFVINPWNLA